MYDSKGHREQIVHKLLFLGNDARLTLSTMPLPNYFLTLHPNMAAEKLKLKALSFILLQLFFLPLICKARQYLQNESEYEKGERCVGSMSMSLFFL